MADQQKYVKKLTGTRVLIVGGTSGIGFTVAEACVEHGCSAVILSSSNPKRIDAAIDRLKASYPSRAAVLSGHPCDLVDPDKIEPNIEALLKFATNEHTKKLDHVVFTAGNAIRPSPMTELTMAQALEKGTVRFFGPLMLAKHIKLTSALADGPAASFTLTTGSASERPREGWTLISSFASGAHGLTRGLALDLKPARVNLISPGAVETELWDGLEPQLREGLFKSVQSATTTGLIGQPEDVAEAYLYAMKDNNLTGSMISTNGGLLLLGRDL